MTVVDAEKGAVSKPRRSAHATGTMIATSLAALLFASFVVVSSSRAAFTATTSNPSNSLTAGSLTLSDYDSATAMFSAPSLSSGQSTQACIRVDYSGDLTTGISPGAVKLYLSAIGWTPPAASTTAAGNLTLMIEVGTTGGANFNQTSSQGSTCTIGGTTSTLLTATTLGTLNTATYTTGTNYTAWSPGSGVSSSTRYFRFTIALPAGMGNVTTTSTGSFAFTWETQK